ncbi:hypothetical protein [Bradyrhizobium liaoningense]|uniref:hypothetical protein n=1 Tax=Bradyrhizobium liaoningense TaxID=43992 RepID=UPI0012FE4D18|nr:hypothetical protein [Bradyrhizobium liaoningense]
MQIKTCYTYPRGYQACPINDQIELIARAFQLDPEGAYAFAANLPELPNGAEAWFAIPSLDAVNKKHFQGIDNASDLYCHATQLALEKLVTSRVFRNYRDGQIRPNRLRVRPRTKEAFGEVARACQGDIHIIPAQLGMRHRGISAYRAQEHFAANEFGLPCFAVASILLANPERFKHEEELCVECAGDEFVESDGDHVYADVPTFFSLHSELGFDGHCWIYPFDSYGSATGFIWAK